MMQLAMFDEQGSPTLEAQASGDGTAAACSAEALTKLDAAYLRRLTTQEALLFPNGFTPDEMTYRLRAMGLNVDAFSVRPRVSELKSAEYGCVLVETGRRRNNGKGNSCAVLVHRQFQEGA